MNSKKITKLNSSNLPSRFDASSNSSDLTIPGDLPPGSRVLYARNVNFVGHEEQLLELAERLLFDLNRTAVLIAATGTGGIGKTQLAIEFAYRYGRYFTGVHWLDMSSAQTTTDDLARFEAEVAACGILMNLPHFPQELSEQVNLTLATWQQSPPRLVILDNIESSDLLQKLLPRLLGVRVLVTSRWDVPEDWDSMNIIPHRLYTLTREQSYELLRKLASHLENVPDSELDPLAERLGDFPLALDLAGRYLDDMQVAGGLSVADYLQRLEKSGNPLEHASLRNWARHISPDSPTRHDADVAATFILSWERVNDPLAQDLFRACGYLAPNHVIPPDLLLKLAGDDDEALVLALKQLSAYDLLTSASPEVHPLLSDFARSLDAVAEASRLPALVDTLAWLSKAALETGIPATFEPLYPHVLAVAGHAEAAGVEDAGALWNNLGYYRRDIADFTGARAAYERALRIDEAAYRPDHPKVATAVSNLGSVLHDAGDLTGARAAYERALRIFEQALGENHPNVAVSANNLGMVMHNAGDLPGARAAYERALRIDEAAYGPDHPNVAIRINNLGRVLQDAGDLYSARATYERALRIWEQALGEDHPNVATAANNLGGVLQDEGDLPGARAAYERALRIDEAVYGPDHPEVATNVNNLGRVLQDEGDLPGARAAYERALRIDEAVYGPDHPNVAIRVNNLGSVLHAAGDLAGARAMYERALRIDEAAFGPDHPNVARAVNNLGGVLHAAGDLPSARAAYERALRILEQFLPPGHPNIKIVRDNLASLDE